MSSEEKMHLKCIGLGHLREDIYSFETPTVSDENLTSVTGRVGMVEWVDGMVGWVYWDGCMFCYIKTLYISLKINFPFQYHFLS